MLRVDFRLEIEIWNLIDFCSSARSGHRSYSAGVPQTRAFRFHFVTFEKCREVCLRTPDGDDSGKKYYKSMHIAGVRFRLK